MIRLVLTCSACPEQYDAFDEDVQVGYLRLRHGHFRVDCPDVGGQTVYEAFTNGDGSFDDDERDYFLRWAVHKIQKWQRKGHSDRPPASDVQYEVVKGVNHE